jgi:hypothetical protein
MRRGEKTDQAQPLRLTPARVKASALALLEVSASLATLPAEVSLAAAVAILEAVSASLQVRRGFAHLTVHEALTISQEALERVTPILLALSEASQHLAPALPAAAASSARTRARTRGRQVSAVAASVAPPTRPTPPQPSDQGRREAVASLAAAPLPPRRLLGRPEPREDPYLAVEILALVVPALAQVASARPTTLASEELGTLPVLPLRHSRLTLRRSPTTRASPTLSRISSSRMPTRSGPRMNSDSPTTWQADAMATELAAVHSA